jgi:hypothetical protein
MERKVPITKIEKERGNFYQRNEEIFG